MSTFFKVLRHNLEFWIKLKLYQKQSSLIVIHSTQYDLKIIRKKFSVQNLFFLFFNDLDAFYENMKDASYADDEHAIYSFLLTQLTCEENRQLFRKDSKLLDTLKYQSITSSLVESEGTIKSKWYFYHLCQRQTVHVQYSTERKSLLTLNLQLQKISFILCYRL